MFSVCQSGLPVCPFERHNNSIAITANSDRSHETQGQVQRWVTSSYFSRSQRPIQEINLSSRYFHTYNLYFFVTILILGKNLNCSQLIPSNTCDPDDETQGQVQSWVTLPNCQGHRGRKEKVCHQEISTPTICIASILIPVIHMMKLKV